MSAIKNYLNTVKVVLNRLSVARLIYSEIKAVFWRISGEDWTGIEKYRQEFDGRRRQRLRMMYGTGTAGQRVGSSNNLITVDHRSRSALDHPRRLWPAVGPSVDLTTGVAERTFHQRRQTSNLPTRRRQKETTSATRYNNRYHRLCTTYGHSQKKKSYYIIT